MLAFTYLSTIAAGAKGVHMVSGSASRTVETAPAPDRPRTRQPVRVRRELLSWPTLVLVLICVLVAVPLTILFTPDQRVTVAGQHVYVGARPRRSRCRGRRSWCRSATPNSTSRRCGCGDRCGPRLTLGPVRRNAAAAAALDPSTGGDVRKEAVSSVAGAFVAWYLWAALILLAITLALDRVRRLPAHAGHAAPESRAADEPLTVAETLASQPQPDPGHGFATLAVTLAVWAACGLLAYNGAVSGLKKVTSLTDLVGTYYLTPSPVGPVVEGYVGAVVGDSGPPGRAVRPGSADRNDQACARSADSLASEIGTLVSAPVANLACPGASVANGLRGPRARAGSCCRPRSVCSSSCRGLKFVVVMVGPNDLSWSDQLRYCYGVPNCQDRLTEGEFVYRLAAFDRDYGDLLHDLNDLPDRPQVIVVTSYDVFAAGATCPDAAGPAGAVGLSPQNIELLISRNRALNDVSTSAPASTSSPVATPALTPLCQKETDGLGPDIQGLADPAPFHPTGVGMLRIASATARLIAPQ